MPGQFLPPDPTRGDANTIGGYMRVHARPAAFEGSDGLSYSVSIETDATGETARPCGAFFLFLRWRRVGAQGVEGHLETGFLAWGTSAPDAAEALGSWSIADARAALERCIAAFGKEAPAPRRWWDAMREDG